MSDFPLLPHEKCPFESASNRFTCFCEDHCSLEICRLDQPPERCLPNKDTAWIWDVNLLYWRANGNDTMGIFEINPLVDI